MKTGSSGRSKSKSKLRLFAIFTQIQFDLIKFFRLKSPEQKISSIQTKTFFN